MNMSENELQSESKIEIIIDEKINPWVKDLPEGQRAEVINNYLKLGYLTSTLCKTSIDPESGILKNLNNQLNTSLKDMSVNNENKMNVIEAKINENLDRVKSSIERLTQSSSKSVLKGNLGENFVSMIIKRNFPDFTLLDTSKVSEASDYHLVLPSGDIFMIEVKNYATPIPTKEIVKFKRDMVKNGAKIGLFISLNTGIIGKRRFAIENLNHKQKILYIPNCGSDESAIVWAVLMGKELVNNHLDGLSINQEKIIEIYDNFKFVYNKFCKIKHSIIESKDAIEKQLGKLFQEAMELDISIYETFKNVSTIINNELHFTNTLLLNAEYNDCELIIEEMLRNGDKRVTIHKEVLGFCKKHGMSVKYPPNNRLQWILFNEDHEEFLKFKVTKTKVDLMLDGGSIVISGNKKGLKYLESFLSNSP